MKVCNFCGAPLDDDAIFCTNCGKKNEPLGKMCPNCGAVVLDDSVFCAKCGVRLDKQVVPYIDSPQLVKPVITTQAEEEVTYDWEKEEIKRKWKTVIWSVMLIAIIAFGGYFVYKNYNKNGSPTTNNISENPFSTPELDKNDLVEEDIINDDEVAYINAEDKERCIITYSQLLDRFVSERQTDEYMDEKYFLFDITGDKIPELWVEATDWSGEFFHILYVYSVSDGQLNLLYKGNGGHPAHHAFFKGDNYIILDYSHMGSIARYKYEYKGGKVVEKELFNGSDMDESLEGYYELTEPSVVTSDITDKDLLNSI